MKTKLITQVPENGWLPDMPEMVPNGKAFVWISTALFIS